MKVLITGVGNAYSKKYYGSSALVQAPDGYVMIDCPDPIHRVLHEATSKAGWNVDATHISDIILTHLHGDHCNGLESLGFYRRFDASSKDIPRPNVHVTKPVADQLWQRLAPAMTLDWTGGHPMALEDYFNVHVIDPGVEAHIAGLTVRCRYTNHPVPTVGLLLEAGGAIFGFSGDTPFEQAHIDWLAGADMIVHESNYGRAHTPIEKLNALPDALRSRIRLIHLPDDFGAGITDIEPLREGEVLDVSH